MLKELGKATTDFVVKNAPTILAAAGAAGVVLTAVSAGKASIKAKEKLEELPEDIETIEKVKVVAPIMARPFLLGAATIFCIFASNREHLKREAALAAVYSMSSKALEEYEEKVIDTIGENKNKKIKDSIAEDTVNNNPPSDDLLATDGDGKVLCFDKWSGRYFRAKIEEIDDAINYINFILNEEGFASLNEFYEKLKLDAVENGEEIGWERSVDGLVSLDPPYTLTSMLYKDKYPVRIISFMTKPKSYFDD